MLFHWVVCWTKGVDSGMAVGRFRIEVETAPEITWSRQVGVDLVTGVRVYPDKAVGVGWCIVQDFGYSVIVAVIDVVVIVAHLHAVLLFL